MSNQLKIEKIETMIRTTNFSAHQESIDVVNQVLLIDDQEDRDLMLERVAIAFTKVGEYEKSRRLLAEISGAYEKSEGFVELAASLVSSGNFEDAFVALTSAEIFAIQAGSAWQKAELLNRTAQVLLSMRKKEKVIEIIDQAIHIARLGEETSDIQDSMDCSSVLWDISKTLNQIGEEKKAIEVATSIKSPGKRDNAIKSLLKK